MNCINFSVGCGHGGGKFAVQCCQRCVELCDNGVVQNHRSRNTKVVISLEVLVAAAVQGTNCKELAIDKGTEMLIWSGQVPMPVTMPTNDTLQGRWYTASGEVVTGPVVGLRCLRGRGRHFGLRTKTGRGLGIMLLWGFPAKLRWIPSHKKMRAHECNMRGWNQKVANRVALNKIEGLLGIRAKVL